MTVKEEGQALRENEGFIRQRANKYAKNGVDVEDLFQEGCIGFLKALRSWRPDGGASLQTYAWYQVTVHIKRAIGTDRNGKIERKPSELSLEAETPGVRPLSECLPDDSPWPDAQYENAETRRRITKALNKMSPRTVEVLRGRFVQDLTLQEVGDTFGLCGERVRQIELGALESLGKSLRR
jgi:RNA polymerase sigma factor (sigma-70 family)